MSVAASWRSSRCSRTWSNRGVTRCRLPQRRPVTKVIGRLCRFRSALSGIVRLILERNGRRDDSGFPGSRRRCLLTGGARGADQTWPGRQRLSDGGECWSRRIRGNARGCSAPLPRKSLRTLRFDSLRSSVRSLMAGGWQLSKRSSWIRRGASKNSLAG